MSKLFYNPVKINRINFFASVILFSFLASFPSLAFDGQRDKEIRQFMWSSDDADFQVTGIPDKWVDEPAVIIAKYHNLSYKKEPLSSSLRFNRQFHQRIKLMDKKSIEEYAQFSLPESGSLANIKFDFYAGFKVIKPNGQEIIISMDDAVREERNINQYGFNSLKVAIPNLEEGDILDYYIVSEQTISVNNKFYNFDPVIFQLHDDYPVVKQKFSFDVLRRCYINLKTYNGAPDFQLTEDARSDKNFYYLEDGDRASTEEVRWMYPYRELPTIKFRVVYSSAMIANLIPSFMGDPGVLKTSVSTEELRSFISSHFEQYKMASYGVNSYMKKHFKGVHDARILSSEAFYYLRNANRINNLPFRTVSGDEPNPEPSSGYFVMVLSQYLTRNKIDHEILVGVPRNIGSLKDLILESELVFMLKVNADEPLYFGRFDNNAIPDELNEMLEGTNVYRLEPLLPVTSWRLEPFTVPVSECTQNNIDTQLKVDLTALDKGEFTLQINKSSSGMARVQYQNTLMDVFDYLDSEIKKFPETKSYSSYLSKRDLVKVEESKQDYLSKKDEKIKETLKTMFADDYDFDVDEVSDFQIIEPGRTEENPEFAFECSLKTSGAVKKAGPNYLLDIGKLIEKQVEIQEEEKEREFNIYMPYARSFSHSIEIAIPEGYEVQGIERLSVNVENATGKFSSQASIDGNTFILKVNKSYYSNYERREKWPEMIEFLEAARDFNDKQVLLKKVN